MGQGIAQVAALSGHQIWLCEPQPAVLEGAIGRMEAALTRQQQRGDLSGTVEEWMGYLHPTTRLEDLAHCHWIIEAIPERLELKQQTLARLQAIAPQAWLASNTSTLSITQIAAGLPQPDRLVGLHFFNPVPRMALVEVIAGLQTPEPLVQAALALARSLGKEAIRVPDSPGFLVNRVARPYYLEAMRLHGEGIDMASIDHVARGMGFPMGPFALMDLIGLDVNLASSVSVFEAFFGEERFRPHPSQAQRVAAGMLGQKSGRGWYRYPPGPPALPEVPEPQGPRPRIWVEGDHALAQQMRQRYATAEAGSGAELILDCRVGPHSIQPDWEGIPRAVLIWGGSASTCGAQLGFGLVPPLHDRSLAELYPLPGEDRVLALAQAGFWHGKTATVTLLDQAGGIGFRLLASLINEAFAALAEGLATPPALDRAMQLATGYPHGLLAWSQLVGLPTLVSAMKSLGQELGQSRYWPHALLQRQACRPPDAGERRDMV